MMRWLFPLLEHLLAVVLDDQGCRTWIAEVVAPSMLDDLRELQLAVKKECKRQGW